MPADQTDGRMARMKQRALRHQRVIAVWTVLGLLVGVGWALLAPATYVAESRLLVGTFEAPSAAIPGYVLAAQNLAGNYARLANSAAVNAKLAEELGTDPASFGATISVTAVPESALLRVTATSGSEQDAVTAADAMATAITQTVSDLNSSNSGESVLAEYQRAAVELSTATAAQAAAQATADSFGGTASQQATDARAALQQASAAVASAQLRVDGLATQYRTLEQTVSSSSGVRALGGATTSERSRTLPMVLYGLIGAVVGAAIGLLDSGRRDRRAALRRRAATEETAAPGGDPDEDGPQEGHGDLDDLAEHDAVDRDGVT